MVSKGRSCVLALALSGAASAAWAIAPDTSRSHGLLPGELVLRPDVAPLTDLAADLASLGSGVGVEADVRSGAPRVMVAKTFYEVADLAPGASASVYRQVISGIAQRFAPIFGVTASELVALEDATLADKDVQFFDFSVMRDGLEILDANLAFRFKHGRLVQIQALTLSEAPSDLRSTRPDLADVVHAETGASRLVAGREAYRAMPTDHGYRLVRVTRFTARIGDRDYDVQAVSATGAVLQAVPRVHLLGGDASAQVYARTWFESVTSAQPISEATLSIGAATLTTGLDGSFAAEAAPRLNGFKGARVNVVPQTGTTVVKDAVARGAGFELLVADMAEKNLAQAMAFHHVNAMVQHAKKYISASWFDRALRANVNLSQTCNAFWDGSSINFYSAGGGCANTALVSDVVYHEWGHGLDANTGGISDGAYSEGFGDIMSMLMTRDPVLAPGFKTDGRGIRNLEPDKVYPRDRGEVHAEGLIIGGTFWDLYKSLRTKYDDDRAIDLVSGYALKTIFTARRYTDVYNAVLVVDDDDGDLTNKTPNFCEINAAFTAHGLASANPDCG